MIYPILHTVTDVESGMTFFAVLESLGYKVDLTEFSFGEFIKNISDISAAEDYSWAFKVDGQLAPVRVDSYLVNEGEVLECCIIPVSEFPRELLAADDIEQA